MSYIPYQDAVKKVRMEVLSNSPLSPIFRVTRCLYPSGLACQFHKIGKDYHASVVLGGKIEFQELQEEPRPCTEGSVISIPPQCSIRWASKNDTTIIHIHHRGFLPNEHGVMSSFFGEANRNLNVTEISLQDTSKLMQRLTETGTSLVRDMDISLACLEAMTEAIRAMRKNSPQKNACTPVSNCVAYIENNLHENIQIEDLAKIAFVSPSRIFQLFREKLGVSPLQYIASRKADIARRLLADGAFNASEVAEMMGFNSLSYFSRFFKKQTGKNPSEI